MDRQSVEEDWTNELLSKQASERASKRINKVRLNCIDKQDRIDKSIRRQVELDTVTNKRS